MLAVGAGFCVFIVLLALFAAVQHRKRRRGSSLRSPLLMHKSNSAFGHRQMPPSQAIPLPPPQYLRCSNQNLRKCSSPGGSDYSLSSSYSSSAGSAHSLSPMSPYGGGGGGGGGYQDHLVSFWNIFYRKKLNGDESAQQFILMKRLEYFCQFIINKEFDAI